MSRILVGLVLAFGLGIAPAIAFESCGGYPATVSAPTPPVQTAEVPPPSQTK